jgi:hypothetical protein
MKFYCYMLNSASLSMAVTMERGILGFIWQGI